jgi:hypothetical protein
MLRQAQHKFTILDLGLPIANWAIGKIRDFKVLKELR